MARTHPAHVPTSHSHPNLSLLHLLLLEPDLRGWGHGGSPKERREAGAGVGSGRRGVS